MKVNDYIKLQRAFHGSVWERYELEKKLWLEAHPEASPQEYEKAVKEIADRLGV